MKKDKTYILFGIILFLNLGHLIGQTKTDLEKLGVKNKITTFIEKTYEGKSYGSANDYKGELIKSKNKTYFFNAKGFLTQENIFKKEAQKIMYSYDKKGNLIKKTTTLIRNKEVTEVIENIFSSSNLKTESNRYKGEDELVLTKKFTYDDLGNCITIELYKPHSKKAIGKSLFKFKEGYITEKLFINSKGIDAKRTWYSYSEWYSNDNKNKLKEIKSINLLTNATSKKTIGYDGFTYNLGIEKTYINGVLKERMTYGYELNEKGDWIVERAYKNGFPAFVTERTYN